MSKSRRIIYGVSAAIAVGLLGLVCYRAMGLYVEVVNNTPRAMTNITVTYTGGALHVAGLPAHTAHKQRIKPQSESGLKLTWTDAAGIERRHTVDVYLEPSYKGSVTITINAHNDIMFTDLTRMGPI